MVLMCSTAPAKLSKRQLEMKNLRLCPCLCVCPTERAAEFHNWTIPFHFLNFILLFLSEQMKWD